MCFFNPLEFLCDRGYRSDKDYNTVNKGQSESY